MEWRRFGGGKSVTENVDTVKVEVPHRVHRSEGRSPPPPTFQ
jgi:hypothetical protein